MAKLDTTVMVTLDDREARERLIDLHLELAAAEARVRRLLEMQTVAQIQLPTACEPAMAAAAGIAVVARSRVSRRQLLGLVWRMKPAP